MFCEDRLKLLSEWKFLSTEDGTNEVAKDLVFLRVSESKSEIQF